MLYRNQIPAYTLKLIEDTQNDSRLLNQFVYDEENEQNDILNSAVDVSCDADINYLKGLYHRYPHKLLVFPTERCLGSCRFCFRKNIITDNNQDLSLDDFDAIENYIIEHDIDEVIFSGGDPFAISENTLIDMVKRVASIERVRIIRIHTRVLSYAPERISESFIRGISLRVPVFIVFHINSHLELSEEALNAVRYLTDAGILCFSQTALLRGVNDTEEDLRLLFTNLIANKIKPYYLFHPDRVKGTSHFYIPLRKGISLYNSLYNRISGLAMPIYLFNVPNGYGHCIVDLGNIVPIDGQKYLIHSWDGRDIVYTDLDS